jgi:hypothetical protein
MAARRVTTTDLGVGNGSLDKGDFVMITNGNREECLRFQSIEEPVDARSDDRDDAILRALFLELINN